MKFSPIFLCNFQLSRKCSHPHINWRNGNTVFTYTALLSRAVDWFSNGISDDIFHFETWAGLENALVPYAVHHVNLNSRVFAFELIHKMKRIFQQNSYAWIYVEIWLILFKFQIKVWNEKMIESICSIWLLVANGVFSLTSCVCVCVDVVWRLDLLKSSPFVCVPLKSTTVFNSLILITS